MQILIKSLGSCPFYGASMVNPKDVGLKVNPVRNTYTIINHKLFFLAVIKYGIEYNYICESKV